MQQALSIYEINEFYKDIISFSLFIITLLVDINYKKSHLSKLI